MNSIQKTICMMLSRNIPQLFCLLSLIILVASCGGQKEAKVEDAATEQVEPMASEPETALNALTQQEQEDGWKLLFDGETSNGWRGGMEKNIFR